MRYDLRPLRYAAIVSGEKRDRNYFFRHNFVYIINFAYLCRNVCSL